MCLFKDPPTASSSLVPTLVIMPWQFWSYRVFECHGNCIPLGWLPVGTKPFPVLKGSKCSECQIVVDGHESALICPCKVLYQGLQVLVFSEGRKRNNSHQMWFGFFFKTLKLSYIVESLKNAFALELPPNAKLLPCRAFLPHHCTHFCKAIPLFLYFSLGSVLRILDCSCWNQIAAL